jgi:hypothetical protein
MSLENIGDGQDCYMPSHHHEKVKPMLAMH